MRQSAKTVGLRLGQASAVLASCLLLVSSVEAKAKPQWSPPIPPGKEAITLTIRSVGKVKTVVTWGRRTLGETPLVLKWPRNSGPVDVVLRAQGHLPVHTRLFTFNDDKVTVKLVDEEGKKTLFGYKREVPASLTHSFPIVSPPFQSRSLLSGCTRKWMMWKLHQTHLKQRMLSITK